MPGATSRRSALARLAVAALVAGATVLLLATGPVVSWWLSARLRPAAPPVPAAERATLEVREVVHDTALARAWYTLVAEGRGPAGLGAEVDGWTELDGGRRFTDYYLTAPSAEALRAGLATLPTETSDGSLGDLIVAVAPPDGEGDRRVPARSYLLRADSPVLAGADVATAVVMFDPDTGRPSVTVTLTPDAAVRFGQATTALLGHKLAIVVDGTVLSAPVVAGAITGGMIQIHLGAGGSQAQLEAEARRLAERLSGRRLDPPASAPLGGRGWLVRLGLGALAGLLAWLALGWLGRMARWAPPVSAAPPSTAAAAAAGAPWRALLITVAAGAVWWWASGSPQLALRGLPDEWLALGPARVNVLALGVTPLLTGAVLAELVALVVPGWRSRRLGGAAARRPIELLAAALTLVLAMAQAWFIAAEVHRATGGELGDLRLVHAASLVGGAMAAIVLAQWITRVGLGHGVLVLTAIEFGQHLWRSNRSDLSSQLPVLAAVVLSALVLGVALLRERAGAGARLLGAGLVAVQLVPMVAALVALVALGAPDVGAAARAMTDHPLWIAVVVTAAGSIVVARVSRPDAGGAALAVAVATPVLVVLVSAAVIIAALAWALALTWSIVAAAELVIAFRGRRRLASPTPIAVLHDVAQADRLLDALGQAGLAGHAEGLIARTVGRVVMPYVGITVLVGAADRAAAGAAVDAAARAGASLTTGADALAGRSATMRA